MGDAPAMDADAWKSVIKKTVDDEGGTLTNGWTVQVKRRETGHRDLLILTTDGRRFRSIAQTVAALTNPADQPASGAKRVRQKKIVKELMEGAGKENRERQRKRPAKRAKQPTAEQGESGGSGVTGEGHPVFSKLLTKARAVIARIRRELDVLEAYEAEGWRGANKGKLKPTEETSRAQQQADRSRGELRELLRRCEAGEGRPIPAECYDSDGGLDQRHIFCAICGQGESTDDNDIVLCDGPCRRAFHEQCCVPRFHAAELDEEADWLCPACFAKDEILDLVNETLETEYELETPADAVLEEGWARPEAAVAAAAGTWAALLGGEDLDSSDGEDESFTGTPASGSQAGSDSSSGSGSSGGSSSDGSAEVLEGRRQRAPVDYVALAAAMFGGHSESEKESDSEGDWD